MGKGPVHRGDGLSWLPHPAGIGLDSCESQESGGEGGVSPSCHPLPGHGLCGMAGCSRHRGGPGREGRELRGFAPSKHLPAKGVGWTGWLPRCRPQGRSWLGPAAPWLCRDILLSPIPPLGMLLGRVQLTASALKDAPMQGGAQHSLSETLVWGHPPSPTAERCPPAVPCCAGSGTFGDVVGVERDTGRVGLGPLVPWPWCRGCPRGGRLVSRDPITVCQRWSQRQRQLAPSLGAAAGTGRLHPLPSTRGPLPWAMGTRSGLSSALSWASPLSLASPDLG